MTGWAPKFPPKNATKLNTGESFTPILDFYRFGTVLWLRFVLAYIHLFHLLINTFAMICIMHYIKNESWSLISVALIITR